MIIKATSHTINTIWIVLLLILLFFVASVGALKYGIQIDNVTLPKIKINQLYIKLDKKLIVEIENISIAKETQADTSLEEITEIIKNFPYLNMFFSEIAIKKLHYDNEEFKLLFKENIFYLDSNQLNVNLKITPLERLSVEIEAQEAFFKDLKLHLNGKALINFKTKTYTFEGEFEIFGIKGISILNLHKNLLEYHLQTENFSNIELTNFMDFIVTKVELEPLAKAWIHQNIIANSYQLHFLEGKLDLTTFDYFPLEMRGTATAKDVIVAFEPTVPPAHAEEIGIELKEDKLIFDAKNPIYQGKTVQKADVYIYNLLTKGTGIVVDLDAVSKLDGDIHKILHAFNIDVPITQTSGETNANVRLDIKFLPYDINATGTFDVQKSDFLLNGLEMYSHGGKMRLDNYLVYLDKTNIGYKKLFNITTTGLFDTQKEQYTGLTDINALTLDFSDAKLLNIKNLKEQNGTMQIDSHGTHIDIPALDANITFQKGNNLFSFKDISVLTPYSPFLQDNNLQEGTVSVKTVDFKTFTADVDLQNLQTPLLEHNHIPLNHIVAQLSTDTQKLEAHSLNNQLTLAFDKKIDLHIKDYNVSIPQDEDKPFYTPIAIIITGENSSFVDTLSQQTLLSDHYRLELYHDTIKLRSHYQTSVFDYIKEKEHLQIIGQNLDDRVLNHLLSKNYFDKGNFSLTLEGKNNTNFQGNFLMHDTYIKDLKFFDNLMATLNAIPSLIVFSDPKFNQEGYFVKNGFIELDKADEVMYIKNMQLTGNNADIVGSGMIDFKNNQIDLKLNIKTLKTFSSAIDFIPIVGGIILGEDRRISTNINVTGALEDPKIETNLILDTLKSPFNIIKRTLEFPVEIFK